MQDDKQTLDTCHTNQMNEIANNDEFIIPELIQERETLQYTLKNKHHSFDEKIRILDRIKQLRIDIKNLKKQKQDYYKRNS